MIRFILGMQQTFRQVWETRFGEGEANGTKPCRAVSYE
jgi:hypothetical protein